MDHLAIAHYWIDWVGSKNSEWRFLINSHQYYINSGDLTVELRHMNEQRGFNLCLNHYKLKLSARWWNNDGYTKVIDYSTSAPISDEEKLNWFIKRINRYIDQPCLTGKTSARNPFR